MTLRTRSLVAAALLASVVVPMLVLGQTSATYDGAFAFTRIRYGSGSGFGRGGGSWAHDYPRADEHLPFILAELTSMRPRTNGSVVLDLENDDIFHHPVIYVSEPGFWTVTEKGADNMRAHLLKGGFVIFDDFEGESQWDNMARQMARVLPTHRWIEIDVTHPIFHSFFEMTRIDFPHPLVNVIPSYFALFDDNDPAQRIIALANYNNDLAEYWEWSSTGMFPVDTTNEAYKLGVNYIIYAMMH
jgi:Domain of unknown function (DUF4159)